MPCALKGPWTPPGGGWRAFKRERGTLGFRNCTPSPVLWRGGAPWASLPSWRASVVGEQRPFFDLQLSPPQNSLLEIWRCRLETPTRSVDLSVFRGVRESPWDLAHRFPPSSNTSSHPRCPRPRFSGRAPPLAAPHPPGEGVEEVSEGARRAADSPPPGRGGGGAGAKVGDRRGAKGWWGARICSPRVPSDGLVLPTEETVGSSQQPGRL